MNHPNVQKNLTPVPQPNTSSEELHVYTLYDGLLLVKADGSCSRVPSLFSQLKYRLSRVRFAIFTDFLLTNLKFKDFQDLEILFFKIKTFKDFQEVWEPCAGFGTLTLGLTRLLN
jgi:hypothetical protein